MPLKNAIKRAREDKREGKSASTQAGEFVREEIDDIRAGRSGARSAKQAIAIGLSEARRAGVDLPPPKQGRASAATRDKAVRDVAAGEQGQKKPSPTRSAATSKALKREGSASVTPKALSRQASEAAAQRTPAQRSAAARKAAQTKGPAERSAAAKKAARTRAAKA